MADNRKSGLKFLIVGLIMGVLIVYRHDILFLFNNSQFITRNVVAPRVVPAQRDFGIRPSQDQSKRDPVPGGTLLAPNFQKTPGHITHPWLRARELRIVQGHSTIGIQLAPSGEGAPALWVNPYGGSGTVTMGVHANGFPFMLVSDQAIRNFGLGRVDGKNASPILVFSSDDIVKMVFGLSMTEGGQPAFLVHYSADGKTNEFLGRYCDSPSRVCTQ
ncbi:MAG: hypothetical protein E6K59_09445 [Nitrospirae bacterium]|nr:MAG: hypothetical protein E6K59_09445 [Nitrospirota bacterium]